MASPGINAKSYMQWGREATWGTAVAATKRLGILSHTVEQDITQKHLDTLTGTMVKTGIVNVNERASGDIELYGTYNDLMMFIDGVMGTATFGSNGGADTGSNPYTHTFTNGKEFNSSFTIELIEGNIPASQCQRLVGAKITKLVLKGTAGEICTMTLSVVAQKKQTGQTPTAALTANASILILASHAGTSDNGSGSDSAADIVIKSFEMTIDAGLDDKRMDCSSAYIIEPIRNGLTTAKLKMTQEFRTKSAMDDYIAATSRAPDLKLVSSPSSLNFIMAAAKIVSLKHSQDGFGIWTEDIELEALEASAGATSSLTVTNVNAQATITTV